MRKLIAFVLGIFVLSGALLGYGFVGRWGYGVDLATHTDIFEVWSDSSLTTARRIVEVVGNDTIFCDSSSFYFKKGNLIIMTKSGDTLVFGVDSIPWNGLMQEVKDSIEARARKAVGDTAAVLARISGVIFTGKAGGKFFDSDTTKQDSALATINYVRHQPAVWAYRDAAQSISTGTWTQIAYDVEVFDATSNFSTVDGEFTAPDSGYYFITARCEFATTATGTGYYSIAIYRNDSVQVYGNNLIGYVATAIPNNNAPVVSGLIWAKPNDKFQIYCWQSAVAAGSSLTVANKGETYVNIFKQSGP